MYTLTIIVCVVSGRVRYFFYQKTSYDRKYGLVGSEMCIRDREIADRECGPDRGTPLGCGQGAITTLDTASSHASDHSEVCQSSSSIGTSGRSDLMVTGAGVISGACAPNRGHTHNVSESGHVTILPLGMRRDRPRPTVPTAQSWGGNSC